MYENKVKAPAQKTAKEFSESKQEETGGVVASASHHSIANIQRKANKTGLPDNLKSGIEQLSGHSMDDVKVHFNSSKPTQVQAHAYTQGTDIHVAPGQEKHLPHEAWHVVQQKQGRVRPTLQMKGKVNVNDDVGLEREADVMGVRAMAGVVPAKHKSGDSIESDPIGSVGSSVFGKVAQRQELPQEELQMKVPHSHPIQMKAYSISRKLPLEPHFKETAADDTTDLGRDLLGKVRQKFPLSTENEQQASSEKWDAERRDAHRPPGYAEAKAKVMSQLQPYSDAQSASTSVWTRGAHVSGLSVASERSRANTPESTLTKKVTKMKDWIGAHLVKREWSGEDNMWNVVSWPKAAEDTWGKGFEEPIDIAFAVGGRRKLSIDIQIGKEDEAVPRRDLGAMLLGAAPQIFSGDTSEIPASAKSMAADAWHNTNRGLESIPTFAKGESELGSATLNKGDTKWTEAQVAAKAVLQNSLKSAWNVHEKNPHATSPDPDGRHATEKREKERLEALEQERVNYRPERYDVTHDIPKP